MNPSAYHDLLAHEAEAWNRSAEQQASGTPPDWRFRRQILCHAILQAADIDDLLAHVRPGMRVLELGCGSGWLTLAMAQRGAEAHGIDIAGRALDLGRAYFESIRSEVHGTADYQEGDLNHLDLPAEQYDLVVAHGILHHLIEIERLVQQVSHALRPGGLLWISDFDGLEAPETVWAASALMFVLPTRVSYREKISGLLRFRMRSLDRIRASMHGDGASPFEGIGRGRDWPKLVGELFTVERSAPHPAITGYLAAEVNMPEWIGRPLLLALSAIDIRLVRWRLLRSSGLTMYARKPGGSPSPA